MRPEENTHSNIRVCSKHRCVWLWLQVPAAERARMSERAAAVSALDSRAEALAAAAQALAGMMEEGRADVMAAHAAVFRAIRRRLRALCAHLLPSLEVRYGYKCIGSSNKVPTCGSLHVLHD